MSSHRNLDRRRHLACADLVRCVRCMRHGIKPHGADHSSAQDACVLRQQRCLANTRLPAGPRRQLETLPAEVAWRLSLDLCESLSTCFVWA